MTRCLRPLSSGGGARRRLLGVHASDLLAEGCQPRRRRGITEPRPAPAARAARARALPAFADPPGRRRRGTCFLSSKFCFSPGSAPYRAACPLPFWSQLLGAALFGTDLTAKSRRASAGRCRFPVQPYLRFQDLEGYVWQRSSRASLRCHLSDAGTPADPSGRAPSCEGPVPGPVAST